MENTLQESKTGGREISERLSSRSCVVSPKKIDLEGTGGNTKEANLKEDSSIKRKLEGVGRRGGEKREKKQLNHFFD